jgi:hypothetical protein
MTSDSPPFWVAKGLRLSADSGYRRFIDPFSGIRYYPIPAPDGDGMIAVPGVTSILGVLSEPEEQQRLEEWRKGQLEQGLDPDSGRRRGSRVHARLESFIRTGDGSVILPAAAEGLEPSPLPSTAALQVDLRRAMADGHEDVLLARAKDEDLLALVHDAMNGKDLASDEAQLLQDLIDSCFYSGMEQYLEPYESFLWNERPLRSGWDHCWSAAPGEPDRLARVWSSVWGFSGTPDLIAQRRRGVVVLGDFKTSNKPYFRCSGTKVPAHRDVGYKKYKKTVRQLCAYRIAIKETLGIDIHALQIIVGLPQPGRAQMFYIQGTELEIETENFKQAAVAFWSQFSGCTVPDPKALQVAR